MEKKEKEGHCCKDLKERVSFFKILQSLGIEFYHYPFSPMPNLDSELNKKNPLWNRKKRRGDSRAVERDWGRKRKNKRGRSVLHGSGLRIRRRRRIRSPSNHIKRKTKMD
jgi:hypothetical protein